MKGKTLAYIVGIILLVPPGLAAQPSSTKTLHLCYHKEMNTVRVVGVDGIPPRCKPEEVLLVIPLGISCWDLNGNMLPDELEDMNQDGYWNAKDCRGKKGDRGPVGPEGPRGLTGLNCWDLDGDRVRDPEEDKNNDNVWDANDCKGPQGPEGPPGPGISDCISVIFPSAQTTISNGSSLTQSCPAGYFGISVTCGSWPDYFNADFPSATSGGCKCNTAPGFNCPVAAEIIVLRCCK